MSPKRHLTNKSFTNVILLHLQCNECPNCQFTYTGTQLENKDTQSYYRCNSYCYIEKTNCSHKRKCFYKLILILLHLQDNKKWNHITHYCTFIPFYYLIDYEFAYNVHILFSGTPEFRQQYNFSINSNVLEHFAQWQEPCHSNQLHVHQWNSHGPSYIKP